VSFHAKADASVNLGIQILQFYGTGGSGTTGTTLSDVSLTTSWQKFTYKVTVPSISGKTIGGSNDDALEVLFLMQNTGTDTYDIAQVKFEEGLEETPLIRIPLGLTQLLAARYHYRITGLGVSARIGMGQAISGTAAELIVYHPTVMRATPSLAVSGVTEFWLSDAGGATLQTTAVTSANSSPSQAGIDATVSSGLVIGDVTHIMGRLTSSYMDFDAELV